MTDKWDRRFLELARHISTWSKDPSTQVGAVIVEPKTKLVVGIGYNGFPRGVIDSAERLNDRPTKYALIVHAEANAILMAGDKAKEATLYVWPSFALPDVCNECAKLVIQAGIKNIVAYIASSENAEKAKRWGDSLIIAKTMCDEAGVKYRAI